jgi:hypothetical protein
MARVCRTDDWHSHPGRSTSCSDKRPSLLSGCHRRARERPKFPRRWKCGASARFASSLTLYPLIRPGSLVQIDSAQRKISPAPWKTDFDRPVYFTELRDGYVCSWCEIDRGRLMVIPHAHAHREVRVFDYPAQAEIVGRVTGVAMRIVGDRPPEPSEPSRGR